MDDSKETFLFRSKSKTQLMKEDYIGPNLPPSEYSASRNKKIYFILAHGVIDTPIKDCIKDKNLIYVIYNELGLSLPAIKSFQSVNEESICKTYKDLNSIYARTNYSIIPEHKLRNDEFGRFNAMAGSCHQSSFKIEINGVTYLSDIVKKLMTHHYTHFPNEIMVIRCFFCSGVQDPNNILQALLWKEEKRNRSEIPFLQQIENSVTKASNSSENSLLLNMMQDSLSMLFVELHNIETQHKLLYLFEMSIYSHSILKSLQQVFYYFESCLQKDILTETQIILYEQFQQQYKDFIESFHLFHYKKGLPYLAGKKYKKSKRKSKK